MPDRMMRPAPGREPFLYPHLRGEAVLPSRIEAPRSTPTDLLPIERPARGPGDCPARAKRIAPGDPRKSPPRTACSDIALIRTFLEVAATGSFARASDRLFVTRSAVVRRLEGALGRPLFARSKAGAEMTAAGREFERYALSLVKIWKEARQQVAIPEGFDESLSIGSQYSLWPRLGFCWIDRLRTARPRLNLRAELGMPDRLNRFLIEGVVQAGLH